MFRFPSLKYSYNELEPFIDEKTMEIHYSKHHKAYVDNLNKSLEGAGIKDYSVGDERALFSLLQSLSKLPEEIQVVVRNNAGGHANHSFFWDLLKKPEGSMSEPCQRMKDVLTESFGSYSKFLELFKGAAMGRFGSGWAWLILNGKTKKLEIMSTPNQDSPIMDGNIPILGVDVWEHAYYLKHQNMRANWLEDFFRVINWEQVERNYDKAFAN